MADKGAKNLIIPSRSGTSSQASRDIVSELQDKGVHTMAPKCDISSATELAALLQACTDAHMPPIKGCINAAMALHDAVFEDMTHAQWEMTIKSKVDSSWNLHQQLPQQMDFFILLSSVGGVFGTMAQANYAAGCTFQDALARHRNAAGTGKMSLSLDLGWVVDAGTVAEQLHYSLVRSLARDMIPVATTDMLAVLDIYCDPTLPPLEPEAKSQKSQLLVGAFMPAEMRKRDGPPSPFETLPLISGFVVEASKEGRKQAAQQPAGVEKVRPGQLFRQAVGNEERAGVVVTALVGRVARSLGVAAGDIDVQRPLSEYGVDSLITIELRNWIRSDFHAAVAVFELMDNGTSIAAVGNLVVERSEIKQ
jgi:aryl carrier-like protein